jgi:hypothetical protein
MHAAPELTKPFNLLHMLLHMHTTPGNLHAFCPTISGTLQILTNSAPQAYRTVHYASQAYRNVQNYNKFCSLGLSHWQATTHSASQACLAVVTLASYYTFCFTGLHSCRSPSFSHRANYHRFCHPGLQHRENYHFYLAHRTMQIITNSAAQASPHHANYNALLPHHTNVHASAPQACGP